MFEESYLESRLNRKLTTLEYQVLHINYVKASQKPQENASSISSSTKHSLNIT
jgi:hypothetical protein